MNKVRRNERIAAMARILSSRPNHIMTLSYFCELFQSAKSTISEDIVMIKDAFNTYGLGDLETVAGAAGGVRFIPRPDNSAALGFIREICEMLSQPDRILPGGFLYMTDIIYNPNIMMRLGEILASQFPAVQPDFIITVETKGIPVAMMTALSLGCPVVVARRENNVTEGSLVSINYVTASSKRIQTMSLSKRAVKEGQKALIIDDFMKGGGTARGMAELLREFNIEILGTGVVIATKEPQDKLVGDYKPLMVLSMVDEASRRVELEPAQWIKESSQPSK